jgi:carnitine-CoA ligase
VKDVGVRSNYGRDVYWMLATWAQRRPAHPFLIWEPFEGPARTWTYSETSYLVERLAAGLMERGIRPGKRLMIHMDNCPEFVLVWLACAYIGAVAVCTNTKSPGADIRYFGEHAEIEAAITQEGYARILEDNLPHAKWMTIASPLQADDQPLHDLFAEPHVERIPVASDAPVSIQYTSGTTARPKAVVWTHDNVLFGARTSAAHELLTPDDVHLVHLPLFHTNAQMYSLLATLWVGGTAVIQPRFSASRYWDVAMRHRCTWSGMVPFCVKALVSLGPPPDHSFRLWGNGISRPPEDELLGVRTLGWYGMTETVTHCAVDDAVYPGHSGGMGRVAPEYRLRLVDDDGYPVGVEEVGNVEVLGIPGISLFAGYLHDEEATAASYRDDGWFITGDQAVLHPDGYLSFAGRTKDMMKVGGENVAAAEVERIILGVTGVSEVAVVGKPDEMLNEVPVAFVLHDGSFETATLMNTIVESCERELASFKVPREVRLVDELPRSTLNKVAKGELRGLLTRETSDA